MTDRRRAAGGARRLLGLGVPGLARRRVPDRRAAAPVVRALRRAFDTVEINNTFYRLPPAGDRRALGGAGAAGLRLRAEARPVRLAPHEAAATPSRGCRTTSTVSSASAPHLGPNLAAAAAALEAQRRAARRVPRRSHPRRMRWAVELRDPSWLHDDVFAVLARHGAALCIHDLLPTIRGSVTADWTYVRFHGPNALDEPYHGRYTGRRLWRVADRLGAWLDDGLRRVRLLQQRLRRRRRRRRPPGSGTVSPHRSTLSRPEASGPGDGATRDQVDGVRARSGAFRRDGQASSARPCVTQRSSSVRTGWRRRSDRTCAPMA